METQKWRGEFRFVSVEDGGPLVVMGGLRLSL